MKTYDYIFSGAGAAGLSLLCRMIQSGKFRDKKILLIDRDKKQNNDRTWCFWEKGTGFFEEVVYRKYSALWFRSERYSALSDISPYHYKLIRGIDFYQYCFKLIHQEPNIDIVTAAVQSIQSSETGTHLETNEEKYEASFIFNSILFEKPELKNNQYHLLQHFKGWRICTEKPSFNTEEAVLMDFRVSQTAGTTFVYVMPFSSTEALVEYTCFSPSVLADSTYETGLREYILKHLGINDYSIEEEEFGIIPMTNYPFKKQEFNIVNIGTAGGQTKSSSGYTFNFIQKQSEQIIAALDRTGKPFYSNSPILSRFSLYDSTLLNILYNRTVEGSEVFTTLFQKNKMTSVLKFLDNETSISEELQLITVLPKLPFIKAAWKQL